MQCLICAGAVRPSVVHGGYTYYDCVSCGTSQLLPQPSAEDLARYYHKFHLAAVAGGVYEEFESRVQADFIAKCKHIRKHIPRERSPQKLLDVGCGKGFFLREAEAQGFVAEGIDLSSTAVEYAIRELGVRVRQGSIDTLREPAWERSFDAVTSWATLEHVPDPLLVLKGIRRVLKPGAYLFLDTGLGHTFWERFLPGHSQWYDAPQHLFVFSRRGLLTLLEQAGFIICKTYTNWERDPMRRFMKAFRNYALSISIFPTAWVALGRGRFEMAKREAKWPMGQLVSIVATKKADVE